MLSHKVLGGRRIELDQLSPPELEAYLAVIELAGGRDLVEADDPRAERAREAATLEPDLFRAASTALHRRVTDEEAMGGLLEELLDDIENRLAIAAGRLTIGELLHDPAYFLKKAYARSGSLRNLETLTGVSKGNLSKLLRGESGIRLSTLRSVAERTRTSFCFVEGRDADTAPAAAPRKITCRDRVHESLGQRIQALTAFLREWSPGDSSESFLNSCLLPEYRARSGRDRNSLRTALHRAALYNSQLLPRDPGAEGPAVGTLWIIRIQEHQLDQLAWLFLAVELHWFEEHGHAVALCKGEPSPSWEAFRLQPPSWLEPLPATVRTNLPHWSTMYREMISRPLFSADARAQAGELEEGAAAEFVRSAQRLRTNSIRLLADPSLRPIAVEVLRRWTAAFDWKWEALDALYVGATTLAETAIELECFRLGGRHWNTQEYADVFNYELRRYAVERETSRGRRRLDDRQ